MVFREPGDLSNSEVRGVRSGLTEGARRSRTTRRMFILALMLVALMFVFAMFGWMFGLIGGVSDGSSEAPADVVSEAPAEVVPEASTPAAQQPVDDPDAPARWLISGDGRAMYTIEVAPEVTGPLRVLEDATAVGTYEWSGSTLTMEFTRVLTMADGARIDDSWTFVCSGAPTDDVLSCTGSKFGWTYHPVDGLDPGVEESFEATATRQ